MNKKNKTENSYLSMFKQKSEPLSHKPEKMEVKKGINFADLEDWTPNDKNQMNNGNSDRDKYDNDQQYNYNVPETRQNKVQEIIQNFGGNYQKSTDIHIDPYKIDPATRNYEENDFKKTNIRTNPIVSNPIAETNHEDYSVNTSYFTNRLGEVGNNIMELSQMNHQMSDYNTNVTNKKMANFIVNSNDNMTNNLYIANKNNYEVIEENEEEDLKLDRSNDIRELTAGIRKDSHSPMKPARKTKEKFGLDDDSLDDDNFSLNLNDDSNVTQNQLEDMNKELKDLNRKIKLKEKQEENEKKNETLGKSKKIVLEPIINNKMTNQILDQNNISNKPKRKYSPYLRNTNSNNNANTNVNSKNNVNLPLETNLTNNKITKPISIGTYQQNTNIMHFQPPMNNMPMYYNQPYVNAQMNAPINMMPIQNYPGYNNNNNSSINNNNNYNYMSNNHNQHNPYSQNDMINMNMGMMPINPNGLLPNYNTNYLINSGHSNNINPSGNKNKISNLEYNLLSPEKQKQKEIEIEKDHLIISKKNEYKPHTLKEYKEKFNSNPIVKKDVRGLGANIGTKEWKEKEEKKLKIKEYSDNIKSINHFTSNIISKEKSISEASLVNREEKLDDSLSFFDRKLERDLGNVNYNRENNSYTPDPNNRTGYSHIHNIRKLKDHKEPIIEIPINKKDKKIERPKSISKLKIMTKEKDLAVKNKIYTTLNNDRGNISKISNNLTLNTSNVTGSNVSKLDISKVRAASSKPRRYINSNSEAIRVTNKGNELDELINNHNFYQDKVEKIRNFINKY